MAGYRVNNYSPSTADITSLMETIDATRTGYIALSLTEYDSTARPEIAGGSLVEVCGALFRFPTTEAISTTGVTSTAAQMYYIKLVPTSSQCSAQFSTTASAWREDLQGYYHSTTSNNRVIGATCFTGSDYTAKTLYVDRSIVRESFVSGISTFSLLPTGYSTIVVNMNGPMSRINGISIMGALGVFSYGAITSYTINSTSVSVVLYTHSSWDGYSVGGLFISGVS